MSRLRCYSLIILLIPLILTGCLVPKTVSKDAANVECHLSTRQLTIDAPDVSDTDFGGIGPCEGSAGCILGVPLGIAVVGTSTFVVSGSIVVVGNTIHWVQKQGRGKQSITRRAVHTLIESTRAMGGTLIETEDDMRAWLTQILYSSEQTAHKAGHQS